ncbi:MAG TPA: hypothetical protein VFS19_01055 [Planctomycetota bacterium]|nr:hypothetical protein [Planctomycetota bacterium]
MMRAAILAGALAVAIPAPARPQDDETKTLKSRLRTIRLDVDFSQFTVTQLADYLRDVAGINIVVNPKAAEVPGTLTIKAKGVTIQSLLRLLLKPLGIGYTIQDGVLLIVRESELRSETRLEVIDVRDLLMPIRDFPGQDISLAEDAAGVAFNAPADETPKEFPIVDLVKAHTGSKSWDENPRASVQLMNGLLFIRQSDDVIAQVRRLLDTLRRFK